jgi:anti-anti-sigma regulatory factor
MIVYHELLPEAYLLVLAADPKPGPVPEAELAAQLRQAVRSGKAAVWVDCRLLTTLSRPAARLLWACHHRLRRRCARLVLCRVSGPLALALALEQAHGSAAALCQVQSLDEAVAQLPAWQD